MRILSLASLLLLAVFIFTSCSVLPTGQGEQAPVETVAVWMTYSEIDSMVNSGAGFNAEFTAAAEKLKELGVNTLYFHTVAFCDAVYPSKVYPERYSGDTDVLKAAVEISSAAEIELHAWINPYRVQTSSLDTTTLKESFVTEWLRDSDSVNYGNVCFSDSGIYLNPASSAVRGKILEAVREIINNYAVSGIHFDDYFYPTTAKQFDETAYNTYLAECGTNTPLELEDWRRMNVNSLIIGTYAAVKSHNRSLEFGVSPAADLDRNYNSMYADVEAWINGGYVDYILPQLYFGFDYPIERFRFENLIIKWLDITDNSATELLVGLPMYKSGTDAEPDNTEWQSDNSIIARQIECVRQYKISGFAFFSYSSLFSENSANAEQLKNIKEVI